MNILQKYYQQDQSDRRRIFGVDGSKRGSGDDIKELEEKDARRRKEVDAYIKKYGIKTAREYYWVAMLYQHGKTEREYKKAHTFAEESRKRGYRPAKWLSAATLDRYLKSLRRRQKYGTQFYQRRDGMWKMWSCLARTTDEERAEYDVDPLKKLSAFADLLNENREE